MNTGLYNIHGEKISINAGVRTSILDTLSIAPKTCIAFVGAGGKTSNMYYIARECTKLGYRVLVTTSTKIYAPTDDMAHSYATSIEELEAIWSKGDYCIIGTPVATEAVEELSSRTKLSAPDRKLYDSAYKLADVILIEADGSKRRPLKVMREYEPVIWPEVTHIIEVAGLSALGRTIEEAVYPPELAADILGTLTEHRITPEDMYRLICQNLSQLSHKTDIKPLVCIGQADTELDITNAQLLAELIREQKHLSVYISHQDSQSYL